MSPKIKLCKAESCQNQQTTAGYCRLHYLKDWKKIREQKKEKSEKALSRYVDHVLGKAGDKNAAPKGFDAALENEEAVISKDEFDLIMEELEYKEDLERLLSEIKVDRDF